MSKRNRWKQRCSVFMAVMMIFTSLYWGDEGFSCDTACKDQGDIWTDRSTDDACRYQ